MCPHCGRDAPIVYRGLVPRCTACGGLRGVLSGASVNLAGKPAKVGGTLASVAGALVLALGGALSLGIGLLIYALATSAVALAFSIPLGLITLVLGVGLLVFGRSLSRSGVARARDTLDAAFVELAAERGPFTAADAARVAGIPVAEADAVLTSLVKREPDRVRLDVDEHGVLWFGAAQPTSPRFRVDDAQRSQDGPRLTDAEAEGEAEDEALRQATLRK